jgi:hypothetical protein
MAPNVSAVCDGLPGRGALTKSTTRLAAGVYPYFKAIRNIG